MKILVLRTCVYVFAVADYLMDFLFMAKNIKTVYYLHFTVNRCIMGQKVLGNCIKSSMLSGFDPTFDRTSAEVKSLGVEVM